LGELLVEHHAFLQQLAVWALLLVPEGIMMIVAGLGFLGVFPPRKSSIIAGLAFGTATCVFRAILPGGIHVIASVVTYIVLACFVLKTSLKTAMLACFVSSFLVNVGQLTVALPILKLTGFTFDQTLRAPWLHVAFGLAGDAFLVIATAYTTIKRKPFIPVPESTTKGGVGKD
jgi:hypothetical protein